LPSLSCNIVKNKKNNIFAAILEVNFMKIKSTHPNEALRDENELYRHIKRTTTYLSIY